MSFAHNYCVELSSARINRFSDAWFLLLYFLPAELSSSFCFSSFPQPPFFQKVGLSSLKGPNGMIYCKFIFFFQYMYYNVLSVVTLTIHSDASLPSSSFPKGCRLEKEQNVSILCPRS